MLFMDINSFNFYNSCMKAELLLAMLEIKETKA